MMYCNVGMSSSLVLVVLVLSGAAEAFMRAPQGGAVATMLPRRAFVPRNSMKCPSNTRASSATTKARSSVQQREPYLIRDAVRMKAGTTTVEPPTREKRDLDLDKDWDGDTDEEKNDIRKHGPLEYLEDDYGTISRKMDDPFHILLMGETFDKPKISVDYVSGSINYVLDMPLPDATDATKFAKEQGFSCLGTWERRQCLKLGRELRLRDICVRVVPYCEGGNRAWQSKSGSSSVGAGRSASSASRGVGAGAFEAGGADFSSSGFN